MIYGKDNDLNLQIYINSPRIVWIVYLRSLLFTDDDDENNDNKETFLYCCILLKNKKMIECLFCLFLSPENNEENNIPHGCYCKKRCTNKAMKKRSNIVYILF